MIKPDVSSTKVRIATFVANPALDFDFVANAAGLGVIAGSNVVHQTKGSVAPCSRESLIDRSPSGSVCLDFSYTRKE